MTEEVREEGGGAFVEYVILLWLVAVELVPKLIALMLFCCLLSRASPFY
jgi:Flp pilus assembly pilin Flp